MSGLIAGGSFAELADFMPGIKVLIQVSLINLPVAFLLVELHLYDGCFFATLY